MKNKESKKEYPGSLSSKLIDGLGFELRTLLNGFVGPIQLLKYKFDNPDLVDIFRMLDSTVVRLERIAHRSTLVSEIESKVFQEQMDTFDIVDLVRFSILEMQSHVNLEEVNITISGEPQPMEVFGHRDMILQVFNAVLENAISCSNEKANIDVSFATGTESIKCKLSTDQGTFPNEFNSNCADIGEAYSQWDMMLAKSFLCLHNAQIIISDNNRSLTIKFPVKAD